MKLFFQFEKVYAFLLFLLSFFIVAHIKIIPVICLLLVVLIIREMIKRRGSFVFNKITITLMSFYIIYLLGVFFTKDQIQANRYLENKFSFILFPLIFAFKPTFALDYKKPAFGLILGVVFVSFLGFWNSYFCFSETKNINCFLASSFSYIHHPTYFSVYAILGLLFFIKGYKEKWKYFNKMTLFSFVIFILIIELMCASLSGLLFLMLIIAIYVLRLIYRKNQWIFYITVLIAPILFFLILTKTPILKDQVEGTTVYFEEYLKSPHKFIANTKDIEGGSITRLIMWTVTFEEVMEHPFGVGTGNVDIYLHKRLVDYGHVKLADHYYNPHNQFLQTFLEIGVVGFSVLVLLFIYGFYYSWGNKNWILLILFSSLFFNSLFESMLQKESGIVFYSFWICLLTLQLKNEDFSAKKFNFTLKFSKENV